jgi:broad specificity phosphatase PhoE
MAVAGAMHDRAFASSLPRHDWTRAALSVARGGTAPTGQQDPPARPASTIRVVAAAPRRLAASCAYGRRVHSRLAHRFATTTSMADAQGSALVIVRHGERMDYVTEGWTAAAPRPWDPPLTAKGHTQAALAGAAIAAHLERLGLPPVTAIYTSPLTRCAETAVGIAKQVGVGSVVPEIDLVETICENWYYSWAIPGANGQWGGPLGSQAPKDVFEPPQLRPQALHDFATLYLSGEQLRVQLADGHVIDPSVAQVASVAGRGYRWGCYEEEVQTGARVGEFGAAKSREELSSGGGGGTVVVCTHGGPSSVAVEHLLGDTAAAEEIPVVGYTGIHVLRGTLEENEEGATRLKWEHLVRGDGAHLGDETDLGSGAAGRAAAAAAAAAAGRPKL